MSRALAADTVTTWKPMPCASWLAVIALYAEEITHLSDGSEFGVCQVLSIDATTSYRMLNLAQRAIWKLYLPSA